MSELQFRLSPYLTVNLVLDAQTPFPNCLGLHIINPSGITADFGCQVASKRIVFSAEPATDQTFTFNTPVPTPDPATDPNWPGLGEIFSRGGGATRPAGSLATDLIATDPQDIYANLSTGVAQDSNGTAVVLPGVTTKAA